MFETLKTALSRWSFLAPSMAKTLYQSPRVEGQTTGSELSWMIKERRHDGSIIIAAKIIADYSYGDEGRPNTFIDLDVASAERVRDYLTECIRQYRLAAAGEGGWPPPTPRV